MSYRRHFVGTADPSRTDPESCEEYGYGLGRPDGILVLKYRSADGLCFGETRQDFLHQLYWSPGDPLVTRHGTDIRFTGPGEAFWVHRAVTHEVQTAAQGPVYRICLRQVPRALAGLRAGTVSIDAEAARLVQDIARPGVRRGGGARRPGAHHGRARRAAARARRAAHQRRRLRDGGRPRPRPQPGRPRRARRVGGPAAHQRQDAAARLRPRVRHVVLPVAHQDAAARLAGPAGDQPVAEVARRVGYATPSAFIVAFTKEYGYTPGLLRRRPRGPLARVGPPYRAP